MKDSGLIFSKFTETNIVKLDEFKEKITLTPKDCFCLIQLKFQNKI